MPYSFPKFTGSHAFHTLCSSTDIRPILFIPSSALNESGVNLIDRSNEWGEYVGDGQTLDWINKIPLFFDQYTARISVDGELLITPQHALCLETGANRYVRSRHEIRGSTEWPSR